MSFGGVFAGDDNPVKAGTAILSAAMLLQRPIQIPTCLSHFNNACLKQLWVEFLADRAIS
jgi:hypothetical protein